MNQQYQLYHFINTPSLSKSGHQAVSVVFLFVVVFFVIRVKYIFAGIFSVFAGTFFEDCGKTLHVCKPAKTFVPHNTVKICKILMYLFFSKCTMNDITFCPWQERKTLEEKFIAILDFIVANNDYLS